LITARSVEETILARAQYKLDIDGKVIQAGKFDNKTSEAEREALLRELLGGEGDNDDKEDNEGEIDDDELNEILARSEDELTLFRQMDEQLKKRDEDEWRAEGNKGPVPPRLMQDDELPAIYLEDPNDVMDRDKKAMQYEILGRGSRQKKDIRYDDGLTEEQWLDAIEEGDVGEAIEKAQERQEKKRIKKLQQEESTSPDDKSKKNKRPAEEEPESATKKKKKKTDEKKSPLMLAHQRVFTEIYETIEEEQVHEAE
jgi:ATP-dependent helicase STH1/SNF2